MTTHEWTDIPEGLRATAQHIKLIQAKREHLAQAVARAEEQYFTAALREWDAGRLTWSQLSNLYLLLGKCDIPGRRTRWNAIMPFTFEKVRAQAAREPDADGTWRGAYPIENGRGYPLSGFSVVYVLFDGDEPVYVGSSMCFKNRIEQHRAAGKHFTYWEAHPCRNREHAYELESKFLHQFKPRLNILGPRREHVAA